MVAANPERTSWAPQQVSGILRVDWYRRPIEAYIPQNVQIIASEKTRLDEQEAELKALRGRLAEPPAGAAATGAALKDAQKAAKDAQAAAERAETAAQKAAKAFELGQVKGSKR